MTTPIPPDAARHGPRALMLALAGLLLLPMTAAADQAGSATRARQAAALDAGWLHTCAVTDDGAAYCWGNNSRGQIGIGGSAADVPAPVRVLLPGRRRAVAVTAGISHSCTILDDHSAWCWGRGDSGQLGDGRATSYQPTPVRVAFPDGTGVRMISAGAEHTCAVLVDGSAWCWGADLSGEVGDGEPYERRNSPARVDLPPGRRATTLSAGDAHTCAILDDGSAWCWGQNAGGALGDGVPVNFRPAPVPVALPTGTRAVAVAAGRAHTCATLDSGASACWGDDSQGTVGNGAPLAPSMTPADIGLPGGVAITSAGHSCLAAPYATLCWGDDFHGQLGNGPDSVDDMPAPGAVLGIPAARGVVAITAGGFGNRLLEGGHTCAAYDDGSVWCWGDDRSGQLGNGSTMTGSRTRPDDSAAALPPGSLPGFQADVSVSADAPPRLLDGREAPVTLRVRNAGPDPATGVRVTVTAAALTTGDPVPSQGTVAGGTWDAGTIPAGGEATLRLPVTGSTAAPAASVTAEVTAVGAPVGSSAASTVDPDSTPGNGADGEDDRVTVAFTVSRPAPPVPGLPGTSGRPVIGADSSRCTNRVRGTRRGETLFGTAAADRITALGGNDRLLGRAGADCLSGGAGRDLLDGGIGNDSLEGGPGRDVLIGRGGRDMLSGGPGPDLILARDGLRDVVRCGDGRDTAVVDRRDSAVGCEVVRRG